MRSLEFDVISWQRKSDGQHEAYLHCSNPDFYTLLGKQLRPCVLAHF
jgi:hypothetical protein